MPPLEPARLHTLLQDEERVHAILREESATSSFCDDASFSDLFKRVQSDHRIVDALFTLYGHVSSSPGPSFAMKNDVLSHLPGEMGDVIRTKDWTNTALGPPETWHPELPRILSFIMCSSLPMAMYWSHERYIFYNNGYIPIFGANHPRGLGQTFLENFALVAEDTEPQFQHVYNGGTTYKEDDFLPLVRNGFTEECYFTWSLGLLRLSDGSPGGILNPAFETTRQVLAARRLNVLRELVSKVSRMQTVAECCRAASVIFDSNHADIAFSLVYILDGKDKRGRHTFDLQSTSGVSAGHAAAPLRIEAYVHDHAADSSSSSSDPETIHYQAHFREAADAEKQNSCSSVWPFHEVIVHRRSIEVDNLSEKFGELPSVRWPECVQLATVLPITTSVDNNDLTGILVVGISPRLLFDEDYLVFVELLARQLASSISTARSFEYERKRAEALAQIDHAKTVFFSNVSHELRTPLSLILGPLEDCLTDVIHPLLPEHKMSLSIVQRSALRLLKLVNSLLDFSRIEADQMQACFEPVHLSDFTADLASMFRATIERAGLQLVVDTPPLCTVYVDKSMYEKIVFNLLSNAFKFTLHGAITVQTRHVPPSGTSVSDYIELTVTDRGTGIPEHELPRVFERFYRIEAVHGRSYEGTGIGLALTLELAKLHGGSVVVVSELGVGSSFTVRFPMGFAHLDPALVSLKPKKESKKSIKAGNTYVAEAERWLPTDMDQEVLGRLTNSSIGNLVLGMQSRILVADDNADMRQYLATLFAPHTQFHVVLVSNGREAMQEALSLHPPDLVISDVMMPEMDGFALIHALHNEPATMHIPIILLSARAGDEAKVEGLEKGADDYLVKPFNAKELLVRVLNRLEAGRMRVLLEQQVSDRTHKLQDTENKFRMLSELAPVGICQADEEGMLLYANDEFSEMIDMPLGDSLGLGWMSALHKDDIGMRNEWVTCIQSGETLSREVKFVKAGGEIVWVLVKTKPFEQDRTRRHAAAFVNITQRKVLEQDKIEAVQQAEAEQRRRAQEAEQHQQQQELFVDMICHEIRNPLNGIINNVDLLAKSISSLQIVVKNLPLEPATCDAILEQMKLDQESIDSVLVCARHQQEITNDVLYLSKLESGLVQLNIVPFDPCTIVRDALRMFSAEMAIKGMHAEAVLSETRMCVRGDPNRLHQIMSNLLSNSIKFTANSAVKRVAIELRVVHQTSPTLPRKLTLQISVADTGIGMTTEEQMNLFQRFSQANSSTQKHYGGSGLGLFISKELVGMMGGEMHVESAVGQGAKFVFTLEVEEIDEPEGFVHTVFAPPVSSVRAAPAEATAPLSNSYTAPNSPATSNSNITANHGRRVLIVEDNVINQKVLKRHLENAGHSCLIAQNGLEAFEMCGQGLECSPARYAIDLIFMDMEMPVMGGLEATRNIREREHTLCIGPIPIAGLSGNARQMHISEALEAGMQCFIVKPYQRDELLRVVQDLTHHCELRE